jgi:hypothetical protein
VRFTGVIKADDFIQKGSPVIPVALRVIVQDLPAGSYRLVMQAVDAAGNNATDRTVDFDLTD